MQILEAGHVAMNHLNPLLHVPYPEADIQKQNIFEMSCPIFKAA